MGDVIGIIVCVVISFWFGYLWHAVDIGEVAAVGEVIAECESTLPRNQTCKYVITAVPEVAE